MLVPTSFRFCVMVLTCLLCQISSQKAIQPDEEKTEVLFKDTPKQGKCSSEQYLDPRTGKCLCIQLDTYFDKLTGGCDPCSQICQNAEKQRTLEDCLNHCPKMAKKMGFRKQEEAGCTFEQHWDKKNLRCICNETDTYLDAITGRCDPCSQICINAKEQRTEEECKQECPEFQIIKKPASAIVQELKNSVSITIVIPLVTVLLLMSAVGVAWYYRSRLWMALLRCKARIFPNEKIREEEGEQEHMVNRRMFSGKPWSLVEDNCDSDSERTQQKMV